jgi:hypothetical protein
MMMNRFSAIAAPLAAILAADVHAAELQVSAVNPLPLARASQTLELSMKDLEPLGASNLNLIHVKDGSGAELLCQAIDLDGDPLRKLDAVLFQSDFGPGETRKFTVSVGKKQVYQKEQFKAFGRFVRERFDDFAWENDRIAHRTYGKALETWGSEPLSSSTIDIWSKRTPRMVVSDWYLADDYHADYGEGADFYSAGLSRGCGGSGLWAGERLWVSRNFVRSNVLANGPIRVLFELEYDLFPVEGVSVSETKRVSLDAGQQFDQFESHYKPFVFPGKITTLTPAAGLKKVAGETLEINAGKGWIAKWEKMEKERGNQGLAIITGQGNFEKHVEDPLNHLVLLKSAPQGVATYWAGFCWDKAGRFTDATGWNAHVAEFAQGLAAPISLSIRFSK